MNTNLQANNDYGAQNITVLEGLEAVRKRPGMYIGNTDEMGLMRMLGEIVDNSIDEFMAGHASKMKVFIQNGDQKTATQVIVADDGRGIPTDVHPKTGKSTLETIMTVLHAGGKFDQNSYQFSGGLHGVGASVVNALSTFLQVWVLRDGNVNYLRFEKGLTIGQIASMSRAEFEQKFPVPAAQAMWQKTGTITAFSPDPTIFETVRFDLKKVEQDLKEKAYLNKNLEIDFQAEELVKKASNAEEVRSQWLRELEAENLAQMAN